MIASPHPVTIIGAGPGGLYAAMALSRHWGIPSIVLERGHFPRHKACGDILTSNVIRALHALDMGLVEDLQAQPWSMPLAQTSFGALGKDGFVMPFHSPRNSELGLPACLSAPRWDFDTWLANHAAACPGVEIRQGWSLARIEPLGQGYRLHADTGETLETTFLLLATGANSAISEQLFATGSGSPKDEAIGLRWYFEGVAPAADAHLAEYYLFDRRWMPGGIYITPLAGGAVNLNAVMRKDAWQRGRPRLAELMQDYIQAHPVLRGRFAQAHPVGNPLGSRLYLGTTQRRLSSGNCLLLGDAAGLTDATNANGIGHAMLSAEIAAQQVALALKQQGTLAQYDAAVYNRLHNALRPGKLMRTLFANPISARISVGLLHASLHRLNSRAVHELVYSSNTTATLLNPAFYWRLFAKGA